MFNPIDYSQNIRNKPKLDTTGLMGLLQQSQDKKAQQQQQQQFKKTLGSQIDEGGVDFQRLMAQFPDKQDFLVKMENQQNLRNKMKGTNASTDAVNLYRAIDRGDNEGAAALINQNADSINSMGDPSFTADSALQMLMENPKQLQSAALNIARMGGGQEAFLEDLASNEGTPITPYQQELVKGANADRELRKLELQDKKLDREFDRAKDDQAKLLVQEKIDSLNAKKTEVIAAKEKKKQEAITSTRQTLDSIDELLNSPGLENAVGATWTPFISLSGTDKADFETALDSFVGNLTLENMSKMSGVLSDSDIKMIQSASSGLSTKMSEKAFKQRLEKIRSRLQEKLAGQGGSPQVGTGQGDAPIEGGNYSNLWGG